MRPSTSSDEAKWEKKEGEKVGRAVGGKSECGRGKAECGSRNAEGGKIKKVGR
jgi:hypothetical protein